MDNEEKIELEQLQLKYTEQKKAIPCGVHEIRRSQKDLKTLIFSFLGLTIIPAISLINLKSDNMTFMVMFGVMVVLLLGILIFLLIKLILNQKMKKHQEEYGIFRETEQEFHELLKEFFELKLIEINLIENSSAELKPIVREINCMSGYISKLPELYVKQEINDGKRKEIKLFENDTFKVSLYNAELKYYAEGVSLYKKKPPGWYIHFTTKKMTRHSSMIRNAYYEL